ncbi:MAG: fructosamine kinase family protein [Acidimicrobiales bacterium]
MLPDVLRERVAAALGVDVVASETLSGGDFASAHCVELADGRTVFAKTHGNPPPHFFTTEAAGLEWLAATGAAAVPALLHASDEPPLLVLEWVDEARSAPSDEASFGRALAALHSSGFECFGRPDGRTTGSLGLPNGPCDSWASFLSERRLRPLARIAADRAALGDAAIARILGLCERMDEVAPPAEPPSLLHGDLWAGNRIVDRSGRSWLIDPACFGGHREFDLAMMLLFGGFGDAAFAAYHEVFPLADGWRDRIALNQLPPLVVHAIKFGGGYAAAVDRALAQL